MSDHPVLPPDAGEPARLPMNVNIENVQNLTFGQNVAQGNQFYTKYLAAHGVVYWLAHLAVAFLAVVLWECGKYVITYFHSSR